MTSTTTKKGYSSLSCISLPSLPTITEEERTKKNKKKVVKHLCAIFNFETFVLDSLEITENEILSKRKLEPDLAITNMAVQEYINKRINTTITLIVIPSRIIKKLKTSRIPCLGKKKSIYITKYKNKKDGEFYMKLSTIKPSKTDKNNTNNNAIKCAFNGMVFAIIFSTFPSTKRFIINGVYYHGHGSPIYIPNFDGREKDLRACKPYDIFIADTQNAIKTLKPFKRKRAKSENGAIAIIKNEEKNKKSRSKLRTRSRSRSTLHSRSYSSKSSENLSRKKGKKKILRKQKKTIKPRLNHSTSINSVLSVSLSPIKESKVMKMK